MKHSTVLALIFVSFGALTALIFFGKTQEPEVTPVPAHAEWQTTRNGARSETPNKDNVSHAFRVRMARLTNRLDAAPDDTTALLEMATLLQDAHRPDSAAVLYERYVRLHPANRQAWLDLANNYAEVGRWDRAEEATRRLLEHYPEDPAAMFNLGAIAANRGDVTAASKWWTRVRQASDPTLSAMADEALVRIDSQ